MSHIDLSRDPSSIEAEIGAAPKIILHFSSAACSVCHAVFPQLREVGLSHGWPVVDIDIENFPSIAAQRLVFTVPTVMVLLNGKEMLRESRFIGFERIERILCQIDGE